MKILITLVLILSSFTLMGQKVNYKQQITLAGKVTTKDVTLNWNQHLKTIDSLKSIVSLSKSTLVDSVIKYKKMCSTYKYSLDTLSKRLNDVLYPKEQLDSLFLVSIKNAPIDAFLMQDTLYNTNISIQQHFYNAVPYYKFQTIQRYPVSTSSGIKIKELILTEVEK